MIALEVEPYCEDCGYFEPTHTTLATCCDNRVVRYETLVECINREKCRNIAEHVMKVKEESIGS